MNNKLLKFILLTLYCVMSVALGFMIVNDNADYEINQRYHLSGYKQIYVPKFNLSQETYKEYIQLVNDASVSTETPVIIRATYIGWSNNGLGDVNWLQNRNKITFYSTNKSQKLDKTISAHGVKTTINTDSIDNLNFEKTINGELFYKENKNDEKFLKYFIDKLQQKYELSITENELTQRPEQKAPSSVISLTNTNLYTIISVSIIFYFIFSFIWVVNKSKEIAIYNLNGFNISDITKKLFINSLTVTAVFSYIFSSLIILKRLSLDYTIKSLCIFGLSYVTTYLAVKIITRRSTINQINNKLFFKYSHFTLYLVKIIIFSFSLATSVGIVIILSYLPTIKNNNNSNYGVLYPPIVGYSVDMSSSIQTNNLYRVQEELGALHSSENQLSSGINDSKLKTTEVNDNFLNKYPLKSTNNKILTIDSNESSGIVLLSEQLKKASNIKSEINNIFKANPNLPSNIKFTWIKSGQYIKTFGNKENKVPAEVVIVFTKNNIDGSYINSSQTNPYSFLIPMKKNTYTQLNSALIADGSESVYPSFIKESQIPLVNVVSIMGNPVNYIFINIFAFLIFLFMILATVNFYIKVYKKTIAIYRLQGVSWVITYFPIVIMIFIQYVVGLLNVIKNGWDNNTIMLILFYLLIESITFVLCISKIEKKDLLNILKGDNN